MPPAMGGLQASPDFLKPSATPPIPNVVASVADVAALAANGTPVAKATLLVDPTTKLLYGQSDGQGGYVPLGGGGSGSGSSYLGAVASQAAMTALPAVVGSECLRTDVGTGGTRYELTALPATTAANWQPIQGVLADGSVVTLVLVDGKLPRRLRVSVASGCQVTVAVGGVTQPVLIETAAGQEHVVGIADDPGVAPPTTVTVQRTAGASSCWYSLEA